MKINEISELQGFTLVGYLGDGWAEQNLKDYDIKWAKTLQQALKMLAMNRADIFIQGRIITKYNIKQIMNDEANKNIPVNRIVDSSHNLNTVNLSLMIRKDSPYVSIIDRFDQIMQVMQKDGTLQWIYDKYINN